MRSCRVTSSPPNSFGSAPPAPCGRPARCWPMFLSRATSSRRAERGEVVDQGAAAAGAEEEGAVLVPEGLVVGIDGQGVDQWPSGTRSRPRTGRRSAARGRRGPPRSWTKSRLVVGDDGEMEAAPALAVPRQQGPSTRCSSKPCAALPDSGGRAAAPSGVRRSRDQCRSGGGPARPATRRGARSRRCPPPSPGRRPAASEGEARQVLEEGAHLRISRKSARRLSARRGYERSALNIRLAAPEGRDQLADPRRGGPPRHSARGRRARRPR